MCVEILLLMLFLFVFTEFVVDGMKIFRIYRRTFHIFFNFKTGLIYLSYKRERSGENDKWKIQ
jgi:hypothetical protein